MLSDAKLAAVLPLIKGSDSVELKLTVPDGDRASAVSALEMDVLDAQIRQVVFFDTPELTLNRGGVVVRARRVQGRDGDTVVKLRPIDPAEVAPALRTDPAFGIEVDAMPGGFVCSGSMKGAVEDRKVKETVAGTRPLSKLLSKGQRAFLAEHLPDGVVVDELHRLGPISVLKLKFTPKEFGRKMVAELWFYPDGSRLLELSTKCTPPEAFEVAVQTRTFLAGRGIDLTGKQSTKTRTALEYFARQLAEVPAT
jgi:hypothetical protein